MLLVCVEMLNRKNWEFFFGGSLQWKKRFTVGNGKSENVTGRVIEACGDCVVPRQWCEYDDDSGGCPVRRTLVVCDFG